MTDPRTSKEAPSLLRDHWRSAAVLLVWALLMVALVLLTTPAGPALLQRP